MYILEGINNSLTKKDSIHYPYFVLSSGINSYFQSNYESAIDSLEKVENLLILNNYEHVRVAICNYYIGKAYYKLQEKEKSLFYFKKVDSLLQISNDISLELIDTYNYLIDDAKDNNDLISQVKYNNIYIKFDSILDKNYKYIKNTITDEYDTPELIEEKDTMIGKLNKSTNVLKNKFFLSITISLILILILVYVIRKNHINKKKYEEIRRQTSIIPKAPKKDLIKASSNIGLSENIIKGILLGLGEFERNFEFINNNVTLSSLAKDIKTNSAYLSRVINEIKQVNFSTYLNNLRIDYAIRKLTSNKQFRSYTIKAIAEESGFNSSQSFAVAFHNKTGIYPSYFIKKLNHENVDSSS